MATKLYALIFVLALAVSIEQIQGRFCDGIPGGTLVRYEDGTQCNRFYACQHGVDHEWYCPPGEFFNQRNQQCEAACNNADAANWCAGLPDGLFIRLPPTEAANCQAYYTCFGNQMFRFECPPGFFFSQLDQNCGLTTVNC